MELENLDQNSAIDYRGHKVYSDGKQPPTFYIWLTDQEMITFDSYTSVAKAEVGIDEYIKALEDESNAN
ncbi:hypothetical protein HX857_22525 [Pseudomonas gingeri]|uniref:hypothetical protein n=1 Tax=Pseudomonas TaxID=286 RepID=UPI0015A1B02E|nr:hypothetical protein [Pseudomonas gingeri]NWE48953.1 hypothetical protein [Pseudomonas gingeri]NWE71483.1 hypothetical protein [Pseudomonas gingeri]